MSVRDRSFFDTFNEAVAPRKAMAALRPKAPQEAQPYSNFVLEIA